MLLLDSFADRALLLPSIPLEAATSYQNCLPEMTAYVDEQLSKDPNILDLIGGNPLQMMYDNHRHHGAFMATVLTLGNYQLLARTLPWVYRAYHNRTFSFDYFPLELRHWIAAVEHFIPTNQQTGIVAVYQWMIERHQDIIALSRKNLPPLPVVESVWLERQNDFRVAALSGNHHQCLQMARDLVNEPTDIVDFYLQILQPVLYDVGILWEQNKISIAQEHLVSAIVTRVMATIYQVLQEPPQARGRVLVTACAGEYHEIGAMMISDMLELDGWQICYLGANVPTADLLEQLRVFKPDALALSVTMSFNITKAAEVIKQIRQDPQLTPIRIIVGGRAFNDDKEAWKQVGADARAISIAEIRQVLCPRGSVA